MAAISPARRAAFDILFKVDRGQTHSDDLLRGKAVSALSPGDRHLATALVLGVLRWQIELDCCLKPLLKRPDAKLDAEVLIALRLGAFQLLHMDRIPARAAIGESVELTKKAGHRFASGMVNAVLRKLASQPSTALHETEGVDAHPGWLVERWNRFFGSEATGEICRHDQAQPALALRVDDPAAANELEDAGIILHEGAMLTAARVVISGDITAVPAWREGRVRAQDEGSQLVAEIMGQGTSGGPDSILDCCAAPGGKTLILAARNPGARIIACESSPNRLELLRARLSLLANRVECRLADATAMTDEDAFDLVLADVPCSGTGTLGRNPEIRHRLRAEDLTRQADRQRLILASAIRAARPGGRIVYSTCSLEAEENEQVVGAILQQFTSVHVVPVRRRIAEMASEGVITAPGAERLQQYLTPEGYLRLLPGALGADGFFIAMLEKAAS